VSPFRLAVASAFAQRLEVDAAARRKGRNISAAVALVGAPWDDGAGINSGAAYAFDVVTGQELFKLMPLDSAEFDAFGNSVAISGNVAIIGAYIKDGGGNQSGAAYLFDVTTGKQLHKLTASDAAVADHFGFSVAIDDNIAMVSANRDLLGNPRMQSSSAYFFDVETGQQLLGFRGSDTAVGDGFGHSVALAGRFAIVGAPGNTNLFIDAGAAYVFSVVPEPSCIPMFLVSAMALLLRCPPPTNAIGCVDRDIMHSRFLS